MQVSLQLVFAHPQNCRDLLPHSILRQAEKQTNKQTKQNKTDLFSLSLSLSLKFTEKKEIPHSPKFSTKQYTHKHISNLENSVKKKITNTG
jgi:hypothetical protein